MLINERKESMKTITKAAIAGVCSLALIQLASAEQSSETQEQSANPPPSATTPAQPRPGMGEHMKEHGMQMKNMGPKMMKEHGQMGHKMMKGSSDQGDH